MVNKVGQKFDQHLTLDNLESVYTQEIAGRGGTGMDGLTPARFNKQKQREFNIIKRKCGDGTYRFTPYREVLKSRGRDRAPRVISIPTVRDRIVLYLLKSVLHDVFDDCVNRSLPNQIIKKVKEYYLDAGLQGKRIYRADIRSFYGDIDYNYLEKSLTSRIDSDRVIKLIFRSIKTPTVPKNYRRDNKDKYVLEKGIPQGLSTSNILAEICLEDFDEEIRDEVDFYQRYVDDILLVCNSDELNRVITKIGKSLNRRGNLRLNKDKSFPVDIDEGFQYLGYYFTGNTVTVRQKSVDEFIESIAALFTYLRENIELERKERFAVNNSDIKDIFVHSVNEKLTGAVSNDRRYGWVFYFMEINDLELLHRIDAIVREFFGRSPLFEKVPSDLKRIARAYWEVRSRPRGGYIKNYDLYDTPKKKYAYLRNFGLVDPSEKYTVDEINFLFGKERDRKISTLKADAGTLS